MVVMELLLAEAPARAEGGDGARTGATLRIGAGPPALSSDGPASMFAASGGLKGKPAAVRQRQALARAGVDTSPSRPALPGKSRR
jgi:hypothetical protein